MGLTDDLQAKRPGEWTQDDIRGLQSKYKRTHFTHFSASPIKLKRAQRKKIDGVMCIRLFGHWVPIQDVEVKSV